MANAVAVIRDVAAQAMVPPDRIDACLVASAAVDTPRHAAKMAHTIGRAISSRTVATVLPDALACWAAVADLEAATAVISGTGSVALAGDLRRGLCRSFGIGDYLLADDGSAFGIARAALRETLKWGEGRSSEQEVAELSLRALKLDSYTSVPDAIYKPQFDKAAVASIAKAVLAEADRGSTDVRRFVAVQAAALARVTMGAIGVHEERDAPVGCFGGVFASDFYFECFCASLRSDLGTANAIVRAPASPLGGAFRLLRARASNGASAAEDGAVALFDRQIAASAQLP